jgi:hypothetical protein
MAPAVVLFASASANGPRSYPVLPPRSAGARPYSPLLIAAPGVPVPKRWGKPSVRDVAVNNGLRHHAILLVLANARLDHGVDVEAAGNKEAYLGRHGKLRDIDVWPITETGATWLGTREQVARNPASVDDVVVLPKAESERKHPVKAAAASRVGATGCPKWNGRRRAQPPGSVPRWGSVFGASGSRP